MKAGVTNGRGWSGVLCGTLAVLVLWPPQTLSQTPGLVARAADVTGSVLLSTGNGLPPFALARGYSLNPGDRVDTRGGGRLVIDLSDGSMVVVHPETVLTIKDYRAAASLRELFEITMGLVRVKINHFAGKPNPYRMNSPTASVAVRGTEFSVAVGEGGDTQVEVYEGAVEVASLAEPDHTVLLEAGRGVLVRPGQEFQLYNGPSGRGIAQRPDGDRDRPGSQRADNRPPGAPQGTPSPQNMPAPPQPASAQPPKPMEPPRTADTGMRDPREGPNRGWNGLPGAPPDPRSPWPRETNHGVAPKSKDYTDGHDVKGESQKAVASAYDQYMANLGDLSQVPFLYRYTAFPEAHLDSLENPAYATTFREGQGRFMLLPSRNGFGSAARENDALAPATSSPAGYGISPQFSVFAPVLGQKLVVGGGISAAQVGSDALSLSSTSRFLKESVLAASRVGNHSFGILFDRFHGDGTVTSEFPLPGTLVFRQYSDSVVSQRRVTAGYSLDFARKHKVGVFARYGSMEASDLERPMLWGDQWKADGTRSTGHSVEVGIRLRGALTPRLSYGATAQWLGLSLTDQLRQGPDGGLQRDRLHRESLGVGMGYMLTRRTLLSVDLAGGKSQLDSNLTAGRDFGFRSSGNLDSRFLSAHVAVQRDITRRLFASASYLEIWRSGSTVGAPGVAAIFGLLANPYQTGNRFSDYGIGWRFSAGFTTQYLYSTSYGSTSAAHAVLLRYTFKLHRE